MNEKSLPRKILESCTPGRRPKGRARYSWMQEVTTGMREKKINGMQWIDMGELRRKIKLKLYTAVV